MSLVLVGLWLAALGVGDLLRASQDVVTPRRLGVCFGAALSVLVVGLLLLDPGPAHGVLLFLALGASVAAWLGASTVALDPRRTSQRRDLGRAAAFAALAIGGLAALVGVQSVTTPLTWPEVLGRTLAARWPTPTSWSRPA